MISVFSKYWEVYGGAKALLKSNYFRASIILTFICYGAWWNNSWWDDSITLLPSLLGFSLGGYAMFVSVGSDEFRKEISKKRGKKHSTFMLNNAMFMHFIVLQIIALIYAFVIKSLAGNAELIKFNYHYVDSLTSTVVVNIVGFFGYFLLIYSILSALAAAFGIYRMSDLYDLTIENKEQNKADLAKWSIEFTDNIGSNSDFKDSLQKLLDFDINNLDESTLSFGLSKGLVNTETAELKLTKKGLLFKKLLEAHQSSQS